MDQGEAMSTKLKVSDMLARAFAAEGVDDLAADDDGIRTGGRSDGDAVHRTARIASGTPPLPADIARLSPISWRHISFLGRYDFSVPDAVANGGLRPLRQPNSEWDF